MRQTKLWFISWIMYCVSSGIALAFLLVYLDYHMSDLTFWVALILLGCFNTTLFEYIHT